MWSPVLLWVAPVSCSCQTRARMAVRAMSSARRCVMSAPLTPWPSRCAHYTPSPASSDDEAAAAIRRVGAGDLNAVRGFAVYASSLRRRSALTAVREEGRLALEHGRPRCSRIHPGNPIQLPQTGCYRGEIGSWGSLAGIPSTRYMVNEVSSRLTRLYVY